MRRPRNCLFAAGCGYVLPPFIPLTPVISLSGHWNQRPGTQPSSLSHSPDTRPIAVTVTRPATLYSIGQENQRFASHIQTNPIPVAATAEVTFKASNNLIGLLYIFVLLRKWTTQISDFLRGTSIKPAFLVTYTVTNYIHSALYSWPWVFVYGKSSPRAYNVKKLTKAAINSECYFSHVQHLHASGLSSCGELLFPVTDGCVRVYVRH